MGLIDGEGRVAILYGSSPLPVPPGLDVYLARPDYAGAHPLAVVVPDGAGTAPSVKAFARRLARFGYAALVPDLSRLASSERIVDIPLSLADAALMDIVSVARDEWSSWCAADRFAAIGLGGGAASAARLAVSAGGGIALFPRSLDGLGGALAGTDAPLLVFAGGASSDEVRAARDAAGHGEWVRYGAASPGFFDDGSDDYDRVTAEDAFHRLIAFLDGLLTRVEA